MTKVYPGAQNLCNVQTPWRRGLPTRDQEAHATFSERLLTCGGRAFEQSKRVRVASMAIRMRSSRSATARRARP